MLTSLLKENGNLCVFELVGHDPLMCGWMMELNEKKCAPDLETYSEIRCEEAGGINTFQAFICQNRTTVDNQKIIDLWGKAIKISLSGKSQLTGWNALAYLDTDAGKLIRGVRILGDGDRTVGRFACFHDKDSTDLIYYLHAVGDDEIQLFSVVADQEKDILEKIERIVSINVARGLRYEEIDPDEVLLEGNRVVVGIKDG